MGWTGGNSGGGRVWKGKTESGMYQEGLRKWIGKGSETSSEGGENWWGHFYRSMGRAETNETTDDLRTETLGVERR